jgi:hypothetical protein
MPIRLSVSPNGMRNPNFPVDYDHIHSERQHHFSNGSLEELHGRTECSAPDEMRSVATRIQTYPDSCVNSSTWRSAPQRRYRHVSRHAYYLHDAAFYMLPGAPEKAAVRSARAERRAQFV